jgi:hypothetical protein
MKHTPGPWKVQEAFNRIETEREIIATVDGGELGNGKANARLIAAAPELYEAADAMLSALADYMLDAGLDVLAERLRRKAAVPTVPKADVIKALGKAGDNLAEVMRRCL